MPRTSVSSRRILIPVEPLSPEPFTEFGDVVQDPETHEGSPALRVAQANQGSARKVLDVTGMRNWYGLSESGRTARVSVNMFVCKPRGVVRRGGREVFPVKILERHPFTPQTFIPMGLGKDDRETYYLVIVAPTLPLKGRNSHEDNSGAYSTPALKSKRNLRERLLGARPTHSSNAIAPTNQSPSHRKPKGPGLPDLSNMKAFLARGDQAVTYGPGTWHAPMVVLGEKPIEFVVVQYANGVAVEDCQEVDVHGEGDEDEATVDVTAVVGAGASHVRATL